MSLCNHCGFADETVGDVENGQQGMIRYYPKRDYYEDKMEHMYSCKDFTEKEKEVEKHEN